MDEDDIIRPIVARISDLAKYPVTFRHHHFPQSLPPSRRVEKFDRENFNSNPVKWDVGQNVDFGPLHVLRILELKLINVVGNYNIFARNIIFLLPVKNSRLPSHSEPPGGKIWENIETKWSLEVGSTEIRPVACAVSCFVAKFCHD